MRFLAMSLVFLLACCASAEEQASDDECLDGLVQTRGPDPAPELWIRADSDEVRIQGDLDPSIRVLTGARVRVCGPRSGEDITATTYQLLEVQGYPALLGRLRSTSNGWTLEVNGQTYDLVGVSSLLAELDGRVVWVAGEIERRAMTVLLFGAAGP